MRKAKGTLFCVKKIFFGRSIEGNIIRYIEAIAYFTDLKKALQEKAKHSDSFVFPFQCHFHKDRRALKNIIRPNFHSSNI
jgi:hypothetical protein